MAQKKSVHAAERDTERVKQLRRAFLEALPGQDVARFKFVDDTSVNLAYTRRYGRALGGQRVDQPVPLHNGPNVTVIAALAPQGLEAVMELDGAVNAAAFAVCLDQVLGPTLVPGDVVVLDNLRVHKAPALAELVEKRGARLLFLPPYSPDFTPVELAFSKLKTFLRTARARTREHLTAPCGPRWTGLTKPALTPGFVTAAMLYTDFESALVGYFPYGMTLLCTTV